MVIERFTNDSIGAVGARFRAKGRMVPDGVRYEASWVNESGSVCYQVMEAATREQLDVWISRWSDLVDFEVIPVKTSADYWANRSEEAHGGGHAGSRERADRLREGG